MIPTSKNWDGSEGQKMNICNIHSPNTQYVVELNNYDNRGNIIRGEYSTQSQNKIQLRL